MNVWIASIGLVAAGVAVTGSSSATSEPEPNEQCNNYGFQVQASVTGDNENSCISQYCTAAPSGAAAVGFGVGAGADGSATASGGGNCEQDANNGTTTSRALLLG